MKKLVWLFGVLLALSFAFPHGIRLPKAPTVPVTPDTGTKETDSKIIAALAGSSQEERSRIIGVYSGMKFVLNRDAGQLISTTERWSVYQANTLKLAIETPGKFPGLDTAIENVFVTTVGTDDVLPGNNDTRNKLVTACDIVINSVNAVK